jgi:hypothetical protein
LDGGTNSVTFMPLLLPACALQTRSTAAQGARISASVAGKSCLSGSGQPDKRQNGQHDNDKPDDVDDVIHG